MSYNFNDFIGLLVIAWTFIYVFNYVIAAFAALFYDRFEDSHRLKIDFKQR